MENRASAVKDFAVGPEFAISVSMDRSENWIAENREYECLTCGFYKFSILNFQFSI
jgi:hypothetical protein